MKKVLYITNIEVPYRIRFFNEFSKHCDLTVLYERESSSNRNSNWTKSEKQNYNKLYLNGFNIGNENTFSIKAIRYIFDDYDHIIIGCYNSPMQMLYILIMKILKKKYIISTDGELFIGEKGIKNRIKKYFLIGATKYLVAGEKAAGELEKFIDRKKIEVYYFSSLYINEIIKHEHNQSINSRNNIVLVVGQYFDYKGMDVAIKAAKINSNIKYKFVGMGNRTKLFIDEQEVKGLENVEIIPFLSKDKLEEEYKSCEMLVLPTRQECWGLVINEAASYGMPIVSTWGSGAAVEFLSDDYPQYLAQSGCYESLYDCIITMKNDIDKAKISNFLIEKNKKYSIESSVIAHCKIIR